MTKHTTPQAGFSAVELLITLFIAAAFLATGYMLYSSIVRDSGATRQRAQASNIAYDYLRRYAAQVPSSCTSSTPLNNASITAEGLAAVRVTVQYSCPQASAIPALTRVQATVRYGSTTEPLEVSHAIYATQ